MSFTPPILPYFDAILTQVAAQPDSGLARAFGLRHVHWGYYENPHATDVTPEGLAAAAETLSAKLVAMAAMRDGFRVLDVGCGFGGTLAHINERFQDMALVGINIELRQLQRALTLANARTGNSIEFVVGNACRLPIVSAFFDTVLAVECIFHFPSRRAFFAEAQRVLKPGGRLVLSDFVPDGSSSHKLALGAFSRLGNFGGFYGTFNWWPPYTLTTYRWLARQTGFRLVAMEDITENTLPTYPVLVAMAEELRCHSAIESTRYVEEVSRAGWVRYLNLAFERCK